MSLLFFGDPHGRWGPLLDAVDEETPDAVVLLGDCDLERPLRRELAPLFEAGAAVTYVYGNHDRDLPSRWDNLVGDHPEGNLHARVSRLGPFEVAGLAGIFRGRVWLPPAAPLFGSRDGLVRGLPHQRRWRRGMPLAQRDAIFPEDFANLDSCRADILVCHEAPGMHPLGFAALDGLALKLGARLVVSGHHHIRWDGVTSGGARAVGLGKAEVFRLRADDL